MGASLASNRGGPCLPTMIQGQVRNAGKQVPPFSCTTGLTYGSAALTDTCAKLSIAVDETGPRTRHVSDLPHNDVQMRYDVVQRLQHWRVRCLWQRVLGEWKTKDRRRGDSHAMATTSRTSP